MSSFAAEVVDSINALSGEHRGHRAAHAKGTLLTGTFRPNASGLTTAPHLQEAPSRVTVRFSNGGGDPRNKTTRSSIVVLPGSHSLA